MTFAAGLQRFAFLFFVAASIASFFAIRDWLGLVLAILLCVPAGAVLTMAHAMILGTIRNLAWRPSDRVSAFLAVAAGAAIAVSSLAFDEDAHKALGIVLGVGVAGMGYGIYELRPMGAVRREMHGDDTTPEDEQLSDDLRR